MAVSENDKLYFDPKTPPAIVVAYIKRLAAGEKAEDLRAEIRAAETKEKKTPPGA
jgi:hypothetical protein